MLRNRFVVLLTMLAVGSLPALAKPNYAGEWKLVLEKSDFGPMPPPEKLTRTIEQTETEVKAKTVSTSANGESTYESTYSTEGKETKFNQRGEVKAVGNWDGDVLVVKMKREFQGMELDILEKWELGDDGKTLTITDTINTPQGEFVLKYVLAKQ